jgi:hypothetical protein
MSGTGATKLNSTIKPNIVVLTARLPRACA